MGVLVQEMDGCTWVRLLKGRPVAAIPIWFAAVGAVGEFPGACTLLGVLQAACSARGAICQRFEALGMAGSVIVHAAHHARILRYVHGTARPKNCHEVTGSGSPWDRSLLLGDAHQKI